MIIPEEAMAVLQTALCIPILWVAFDVLCALDRGGWYPLRLALILTGAGALAFMCDAWTSGELWAKAGGALLAVAMVIVWRGLKAHRDDVIHMLDHVRNPAR